jgi:hypothetical protein
MPQCPACSRTVDADATQCAVCGAPFDKPALGLLESRLSPEAEAALGIPSWLSLSIGILCIGGAALGLVAVSVAFVQSRTVFPNVLVCLLAAALYVFGAYCGVFALQRRVGWYRKNLVFLWLQVPIVTSPVASYAFASGAYFSVWLRINPWGAGSNFGVGSSFQFNLFVQTPWGLGINTLALAAVLLLTSLKGTQSTSRIENVKSGSDSN